MTDRVHVITDGKWPEDRDPDEWVVVVPTAQNAAMWLEMGEPIEAFTALESVIGWQAIETFRGEGFPVVELEAFPERLITDAPYIYANFLAAVAHMEAGGKAGEAAISAIGALDALRRGRDAIGKERADPMLADVITRSVLAGYAASRLGVEPEVMKQPDAIPKAGGVARAEQRRKWWPIAARRAEKLAAEKLDRTLADIGRLVHKELQQDSGLTDVPSKPAKVAERLRLLEDNEDPNLRLVWPEGSAARRR